MTPEQKMQTIVEKAGEKWHEVSSLSVGYNVLRSCKTCGVNWQLVQYAIGEKHNNPSPTDLNELFRLAEKLGYKGIGIAWDTEDWRAGVFSLDDDAEANAPTPAEALLNALYHAVTEQKS